MVAVGGDGGGWMEVLSHRPGESVFTPWYMVEIVFMTTYYIPPSRWGEKKKKVRDRMRELLRAKFHIMQMRII